MNITSLCVKVTGLEPQWATCPVHPAHNLLRRGRILWGPTLDLQTQILGGWDSELPLTHPSRQVPVGLRSRMTVLCYLAPLPFYPGLGGDLVLKNPQIQWLSKISESCEKLLLRLLLLIQNLLWGSKFRIIQVRRVFEALSFPCPPHHTLNQVSGNHHHHRLSPPPICWLIGYLQLSPSRVLWAR